MKKIGIITLVIGLIGLFFTMGMDTSVASYGGRVHNIGLMNEKQNFLLLFIAVSIVGVVILVFGRRTFARTSMTSLDSDQTTRNCPFCAERIMAQAILCRYCDRDITPLLPNPAENITPSEMQLKCPNSHKEIEETDADDAVGKNWTPEEREAVYSDAAAEQLITAKKMARYVLVIFVILVGGTALLLSSH